MTDLTIEMIEGLTSSKKTARKPPAHAKGRRAEAKTESERAMSEGPEASAPVETPDIEGDMPDTAGGASAAGDAASEATGRSALEELLSHSREKDGSTTGGPRPPHAASGPRPVQTDDVPDEVEELAQCLGECPSFTFHRAGGSELDPLWEAPSTATGKSCSIRCSLATPSAALVSVDTGFRVRPERIRAANVFAMMANGILRLRGFKRIGHDGAVRFCYLTAFDDPKQFDDRLWLALASCEDGMRQFCRVSEGSSPSDAFEIFSERRSEEDDFDEDDACDGDFDPAPRGSAR